MRRLAKRETELEEVLDRYRARCLAISAAHNNNPALRKALYILERRRAIDAIYDAMRAPSQRGGARA